MTCTFPTSAQLKRVRASGFTFIELLVVMGMMGVILGLGIGFLSRVGAGARVSQAATIVAEAGFECLNRSVGGRRTTLLITKEKDEEEKEIVVVTQSVQRQILTSHFEDVDWTISASGPDTAKPQGSVKLDENGYAGSCAVFGPGGVLDFGTKAVFAPTDGIEVDVDVKPAGGHGSMMILRGEDSGDSVYEVLLSKDALTAGTQDTYKVQLRVAVNPADQKARADGSKLTNTFETVGSPVLADKWSRLQVSYDGRDAILRVDGVDRTSRPDKAKQAKDAPPPGLYRLVVPVSGGVHLKASNERYGFYGAMDDLSVSGIFRTDEDRRILRNVEVTSVQATRMVMPPIRIVWWNGRLDPQVHSADETIELSAETESTRWRMTFGLYGSNTPPQRFAGGPAEAPAPSPTVTPPK